MPSHPAAASGLSRLVEEVVEEAAVESMDEGHEGEVLDPENDMRMINKLLEMLKKDEEFDKVTKARQLSLFQNHELWRCS